MHHLPSDVRRAAERIAARRGVSVDEVVRRFSAAIKKRSFTLSDFFWGESDISLYAARPSRSSSRSTVSRRSRS